MDDELEGSSDNEELTEFGQDQVEGEEEQIISISSQSQRSRGRPRIQEKWTRVINVDSANPSALRSYAVSSDLLVSLGLPNQPMSREK